MFYFFCYQHFQFYSPSLASSRLNRDTSVILFIIIFLIIFSKCFKLACRQAGRGADHSVLKLFTGFAIAALIAWKLIVINAISAAINPAIANTHHGMLILYAKSCNQLCITHQVTGTASRNEIPTRVIKSFDKMNSTFCTDAPNTFRIPISFVR